jgi:hypothetical protein
MDTDLPPPPPMSPFYACLNTQEPPQELREIPPNTTSDSQT